MVAEHDWLNGGTLDIRILLITRDCLLGDLALIRCRSQVWLRHLADLPQRSEAVPADGQPLALDWVPGVGAVRELQFLRWKSVLVFVFVEGGDVPYYQ